MANDALRTQLFGQIHNHIKSDARHLGTSKGKFFWGVRKELHFEFAYPMWIVWFGMAKIKVERGSKSEVWLSYEDRLFRYSENKCVEAQKVTGSVCFPSAVSLPGIT